MRIKHLKREGLEKHYFPLPKNNGEEFLFIINGIPGDGRVYYTLPPHKFWGLYFSTNTIQVEKRRGGYRTMSRPVEEWRNEEAVTVLASKLYAVLDYTLPYLLLNGREIFPRPLLRDTK